MSAAPLSPPDAAEPAAASHRLEVMLFTDLVDSTRLKVELGDMVYATQVARRHNELFRATLARYPGAREISYTGDGFFASFRSVCDAVETALLFHHALRTQAWPCPVSTRIGIHIGQAVVLDDNGTAVTLASHAADMCARLMSLGAGGQTLLTRHAFDDARQYVRAHPALPEGGEPPVLQWAAHGPYLFKGEQETMEVYEVGAVGLAPLTAPPNAEKARRAVRPGEEETLGWRPAQGISVPGRPGWELIRKIGEGGFGEVWLAEQQKMRQQRVYKFCFDEDRLRSFKRELTFFRLIRDALGDREDIARLYDVKLDTPPFFLESEYAVHGNLVEWCARQGGVSQVPRERRLEILIQVTEAVAAAHSVGILHKDIKPQNILMQARGKEEARPQISDFGIGALDDHKVLEAHQITAAGFTMTIPGNGSGSGSSMTRLYAPPEQLSGKAYTVQGDVYALGMVLYQLLIGDFSRALAPGWERDVDDELLREDLAACLDGDPTRRLASAAELATRLRSLEERRAEREAEQRRASRALRRKRRTAMALTASVILAIAVASLGVALFRERGLRQRALDAEKLAHFRQEHAEQARDAAENLINEAIYGLRKKLLAVGKIDALEEMVGAAEGYYKRLPAELFDDEARMHLVSLSLNRATIAEALGRDVESEGFLAEALKLGEELAVRHPDRDKLQEEICYAQVALCHLYMDRSDTDSLLKGADAVAARCDAVLRARPQTLWAMHYAAQAHSIAAQATTRLLREQEKAWARFDVVGALAARMRQAGGETAEVCEVEGLMHYGYANVYERWGRKELMIGEFEQAQSSFARALELGRESALLRELHLGAMHSAGNHLRMLSTFQNHDEAGAQRGAKMMQAAFEGRRKLVELEPGRAEWWRDLAHSYQQQGYWAAQEKRFEEALAFTREALRCREEAIQRQVNRPLLLDERGTTYYALANALTSMSPPQTAEAADCVARSVEDYAEARKQAGFKKLTRPDVNFDLQKMGILANTDSTASLAPLRRARAKLANIVQEAPGQADLAECYFAICRHLKVALVKTGVSEEAAIQEAGLEGAKENPAYLRPEMRAAAAQATQRAEAFRAAAPEKREALAQEVVSYVQKTLATLQKFPDLLPAKEQLWVKASLWHAQGAVLSEYEKIAEAEPALREAARLVLQKAALETEVGLLVDAYNRAYEWQSHHGRALYKLGQRAEGLRLMREAAEAAEKVVQQNPTPVQLSNIINRWRDIGNLNYSDKSLEATRAFAKKHAAEIAGSMLEKPTPSNLLLENSWHLHTAAWAFFEAGDSHLAGRRLAEAEPLLQRARDVAQQSLAIAPQAYDRVDLAILARLKYAQLLTATDRTAEAGPELDLVEADWQAYEKRLGRAEPRLERRREYLNKLRQSVASAAVK